MILRSKSGVLTLCALSFFLVTQVFAEFLLFDNGGMVTHPGSGPGGADVSMNSATHASFGTNVSQAGPSHFWIADDFEVPAGGWTVTSIVTHAYETGAETPTWTDGALYIWDGSPDDLDSAIVAEVIGFHDVSFTNIYRTGNGNTSGTQRPIHAVEWQLAEPLYLSPGTYWIDWQLAGGASAWAPFVMEPNTVEPDEPTMVFDNALQHTEAGWQLNFSDMGAETPFLVSGFPDTASTITVDTTDDDLTVNGNCSLREAVQAANTKAPVDACPAGADVTTIIVPAGTYTLSIEGRVENDNQTGDLDVLGNVIVEGAGAAETILDAGGLDRFLDVRPGGAALISGVTVTGGANISEGAGGGLRAFEGTLHLQDVIVASNSSTGTEPLTGGQGGGVAVSSGTLIMENSEVHGNTAGSSGGGIYLRNSQATISHSRIATNESEISGGGIANVAVEGDASLTITDSEVVNNEANNNAGGIANVVGTGRTATLVVERVTVSGNSAAVGDNASAGLGGGLANLVFVGAASGTGSMTIRDSVISNNQATNGAGIGNTPATATGPVAMQLTVENSAISGNTAGGNGFQTGNGGGILSLDGSLTVINSTISGNTAAGTAGAAVVSGIGGGILIGSQALPHNATMVANTVANNVAVTGASGVAQASLGGPTSAAFKNNILAGNAGLNCFNNGGTMISLGFNLESTDSCGFDQASDLIDTDPLLSGLTSMGSTFVHPLNAGSPAIDAGSCTDASDEPILFDQRGVSRPQGKECDIGAFEYQPLPDMLFQDRFEAPPSNL